MKKRIFAILLLIPLFIATACTKDDDDNGGKVTVPERKIDRLISSIVKETILEENRFKIELVYNDDLTIKQFKNVSAQYTFIINPTYSGRTIRMFETEIHNGLATNHESTGTMDAIGNITNEQSEEADFIDEYHYTYVDGRLTKLVNKYDGFGVQTKRANKKTKVNLLTSFIYHYEWEGGNIARVVLEDEMTTEYKYSIYENKTNLDMTAMLTRCVDGYIGPIFSYMWRAGVGAKNLITEIKRTNIGNTHSIIYSYTYLFNNDGYPISFTINDGKRERTYNIRYTLL